MSKEFDFGSLNPKKEVKPEHVHPPKAPPKTTPPKKEEKETTFEIDWVKVANSSDFKRAVYLALEGKVWRGKDADLEKHLNQKIEIFRDPNFSGVVNELKEHFKNGFTKPSQINK